MTGRVENKVAFITGASRGQGRAHAVRLAQEGADVIALDVCDKVVDAGYPAATSEDLAETAAQVEALDRRVVAVRADVRDYTVLEAALADGVAELGGLDIVIANAGVCNWNRFWEMPEQQWQDLIDINLTGVWHTLKAAAPIMIGQGRGGSMIVTSSVSGLKALPAQAHYVSAKHALVGLVKAAAIELAPYGIRVNSLHPWGVNTDMGRDTAAQPIIDAHPTYAASFGQILTSLQTSEPEDIAAAALWLASGESRTVTGTQLTVDHGATKV